MRSKDNKCTAAHNRKTSTALLTYSKHELQGFLHKKFYKNSLKTVSLEVLKQLLILK